MKHSATACPPARVLFSVGVEALGFECSSASLADGKADELPLVE